MPLLHQALKAVSDTVAKGGRVLFVGTKRQAAEEIAEAAKRCGQYFVNSRWLGGTLTNWKTISGSIARLRKLDEQLGEGAKGLTKKERLMMTREREKLEKALGGIKDMGGVPDLVFVIDTNKEALAIKEANKLKIPVVAILDTNCDPDGVAYPIPGNDDASRAIQLYCDLVARAAIDGISRSQGAAGVDIGAAEAPIAEAAARAAAAEPPRAGCATSTDQFELLAAPRGAPDDLAKLTGVGPQIVKKLNEHGVFHYWQLAAMTQGRSRQARRRPQLQRPHRPRPLGRPGARAASPRRDCRRSRFVGRGPASGRASRRATLSATAIRRVGRIRRPYPSRDMPWPRLPPRW